jgi:hypothetical protein
MTPAETIRSAAVLMRARANAARSSASGRWSNSNRVSFAYPQRIADDASAVVVADTFTGPQHPPAHADHIAAADPVLMLAIADWLDEEAADLAAFEAETGPIGEPTTGHWAHALRVSGLYLRDGWRTDG